MGPLASLAFAVHIAQVHASLAGPSKIISGPGAIGYLALGTTIPFLEGDHSQTQQALRGVDAVASSVALTEALKFATKEPRPDTGSPDSFPSGHASASFAMATVRSQFRPGQAWLWFGGASLISVSRVTLNRHRWHDVFAGALLGYGVARFELSQKRGLLFNPFIDRSTAQSQFVPTPTGFSPILSGGIGFSWGTKF